MYTDLYTIQPTASANLCYNPLHNLAPNPYFEGNTKNRSINKRTKATHKPASRLIVSHLSDNKSKFPSSLPFSTLSDEKKEALPP